MEIKKIEIEFDDKNIIQFEVGEYPPNTDSIISKVKRIRMKGF